MPKSNDRIIYFLNNKFGWNTKVDFTKLKVFPQIRGKIRLLEISTWVELMLLSADFDSVTRYFYGN